ncbi:MAG: Cold shock protein ScoF [Phycisphaerae bacterium]|nr:Cold shock protein ScoF [Phycisphaerae bacterium]
MARGVVKWFDQRKGFGFITDADGHDLFVHYTNVNPATRQQLVDGQPVTFEVAAGEKGPMAVKVDVIADAGDPPAATQ